MTRRALLAAVAIAVVATSAPAQETCPEGRPVTGDLGIDRYRCIGGACQIWIRTERGLAHDFTTEPRIHALDPDGPAADRLRVGDVVVAVDDVLITTPAGGRRIASLDPGVPVQLWIRREGRDLHLEVIPTPGCGVRGLSVRIPGAR